MSRYHGYSYPPILGWSPLLWLWSKFCCPRGWHLWDEVPASYDPGEPDHWLACDACGCEIEIGGEDECV